MPRLSFLPGNDAADELAGRVALLVPSAGPCSLFPLTSRIHSFLSSDWRRTVSSKFFDTQIPSVSTEDLVLPSSRSLCPLSFSRQWIQSLLNFYLSRIDRSENPSCSTRCHPTEDTPQLILYRPAADSLRRSLFGDSLSLYNL